MNAINKNTIYVLCIVVQSDITSSQRACTDTTKGKVEENVNRCDVSGSAVPKSSDICLKSSDCMNLFCIPLGKRTNE